MDEIEKIKDKLITFNAEKIIERIQEAYEKNLGQTIHKDYALEHFERSAKRFNIFINEDEKTKLNHMKIRMYDNAAKQNLETKKRPENIIPNNVIQADFSKNRKNPKL